MLSLIVEQSGKGLLVGVVAMLVTHAHRPIRQDLLSDIAAQLFQAGDVAPVRVVR